MQTSNTGGIQNTGVSNTGAYPSTQNKPDEVSRLAEEVRTIFDKLEVIENESTKREKELNEKVKIELEKKSEIHRNWIIGAGVFVFISLLGGIASATWFIMESFYEYKNSQTVMYNELKNLNKERMDDAIKYTKFYECIKNRKYWEYKLCTE